MASFALYKGKRDHTIYKCSLPLAMNENPVKLAIDNNYIEPTNGHM